MSGSYFQLPIFQHRLSKPSTHESHRNHGHINTSPLKDLIASANDYLSSMSSFSNFDDTTMYYIMVNSDTNNLMDGTGKSRSNNDIASENL